MGLIRGHYDAKEEGFLPGGCSLHNAFCPHGPDAFAFEKATHAELKPQRYKNTLAFMFESRAPWKLSRFALDSPLLDSSYAECWNGLSSHFSQSKET